MASFPGRGLLRLLRPISAASIGDRPSHPPADNLLALGPSRWFPRSPWTVPRVRRPAMPLRPRHGYAAGFHRDLLGRRHRPVEKFSVRLRADMRRSPAHIRQVEAGGFVLRGFHTLVHSRYTFPCCLPSTKSSDSSDSSRRCQGCFPPSSLSQGSGCPQLLSTRCDGLMAVSFHHGTVQRRLVAHYIPGPALVGRGRFEVRHSMRARDTLVAALLTFPVRGQEPIHRARRCQIRVRCRSQTGQSMKHRRK